MKVFIGIRHFVIITTLLLAGFEVSKSQINGSGTITSAEITIKKTGDFSITGKGTSEEWNQAEWVDLIQRGNHQNTNEKNTKVKILYSDNGMYFLFFSEDEVLNATFDSDFEELWNEDVVEVFLWTDESRPHYFEYEISPLNFELPLIVSNIEGELLHWVPFANSYHEDHDRFIHHKTSVEGGEKESGAKINSWTAEFFIPFKLLHPLENIFPEPGTKWRANFYRIDYDHGITPWSWQPYETNFHDYKNFGTIIFD